MTQILIIEDNLNNLELMSYLLSHFGYSPIIARDGLEGINMAKSEMPDLILCDVQMPVLDGYAVARELKDDPKLCDIPRIAVTSLAMVGDREKVLASGFFGYIAKPIEPETFVKQIELFLPSNLRCSGNSNMSIHQQGE